MSVLGPCCCYVIGLIQVADGDEEVERTRRLSPTCLWLCDALSTWRIARSALEQAAEHADGRIPK